MKSKNKKILAVIMAATLFLAGMPELFEKKASAAETAWKVLGEEDLPVDELYGWYPNSDSSQGNLMIGRKDGKLALLDGSMKLLKKTEYDQIEDYLYSYDLEFLVSRPMDRGSEFATMDRTGKITVHGTYKKVELLGRYVLYAEKVSGDCGFVFDGREIGFDKSFVDKPEEAVVKYGTVPIGKSTYYVKQYFETEDVYDEVGEFYYGISIAEMKEKLQAEQCEFIFYDETGTIVDAGPLIAECEKAEKDEEERKKQDVQVITELEQTAASQLPIREYIKAAWKTSTGGYTVNDVTAYRFGDGYLAYAKTDVEFSFEGDEYEDPYYFAGFFDREKKLVKFGEVIAARDEDYWDEGIYLTIKDKDKKIYFYGDDDYDNTGNMVKYLYTDAEDTFSGEAYELASAYPDCVILSGYGKYLVASPMNDFVTTTSMCTRLEGKNALRAEYAVLDEKNGTKQAVFYDSEWKEIKSIDVSRINGDIQWCDGVVLGQSCAILYKTRNDYYGLIGMNGSIVVDAEREKYTYGSVRGSYFEKFHVLMEKDGENYYYYGEDLLPHTEEEYENWEANEDDENPYGDITYDWDYLYDAEDEVIGICEKVMDHEGNVIVDHEVTGEAYEQDENYVYIFKDCKSIVVVDHHWNGKREKEPEKATPTPKRTGQPTITPGNSSTPEATGRPTAAPGNSSTPKPSNPPLQNNLSNPRVSLDGVVTWDCVYFGNYWQENTNGDGKTDKEDKKKPIKWRVLSVDGDDAFLLADKNLDTQRYNDMSADATWETCTIRSWLNGYGAKENICGKNYSSNNFMTYAFTDEEQAAIKTTDLVSGDDTEEESNVSDKAYLLSLDEVTKSEYGFVFSYDSGWYTHKSVNTAYVADGGEINSNMASTGSVDWWWLRSSRPNAKAVCVYGGVAPINVHGQDVGAGHAVRPALHLDLSSVSNWSYAGTVYIDEKGEEIEVPTVSPRPTEKPTGEPQTTSIPQPIQPPEQVAAPSDPVPAVSPVVTKTGSSEKDDEDDDFEEEENILEDGKLSKGDYFMTGNFGYKITKLKKKKGEIAVVCVRSKKSKSYVIPDKVKKQGITFTVTSIQNNAFKGCKKAKMLNIKAAGIKTIGKKTLNGLNKKIRIKVPKKKLWVYRKMLRKCGYWTVR